MRRQTFEQACTSADVDVRDGRHIGQILGLERLFEIAQEGRLARGYCGRAAFANGDTVGFVFLVVWYSRKNVQIT